MQGARISKQNLKDYGMSIITGGNLKTTTPIPQGSTGPLSNFGEMKDMIEVKTSNNYALGK